MLADSEHLLTLIQRLIALLILKHLTAAQMRLCMPVLTLVDADSDADVLADSDTDVSLTQRRLCLLIQKALAC